MILATGITGFSGKYFLQELIDNKFEDSIRCIVRNTSDTSLLDNSGLNVDKLVGDLNDQKLIEEATIGVDTVLHIGSIFYSVNVIKACVKNGVKRAILVHTTGIYSKFKNASQEYKEIERQITETISDSKVITKVTILRPTMIYGDICDRNISKFIKMIDMFRVFPVINWGQNYVQPVNARDLGKAYFDVLMAPEKTVGKSYDLSGEKPLRMIEILNSISENLRKKTLFINVPLSIGVFLAKAAKTLTFGKIDYIEKVQRMGEDRSYSHEKALMDFNYKPIRFEDGIKIEVKQYQIKKSETE